MYVTAHRHAETAERLRVFFQACRRATTPSARRQPTQSIGPLLDALEIVPLTEDDYRRGRALINAYTQATAHDARAAAYDLTLFCRGIERALRRENWRQA